MRYFRIIIAVLAAMCTAVARQAIVPDSALVTVLRSLKGSPLSLRQSIDIASSNSTVLRKSEATALSAAGSLRHEAGLFDPALFFNMRYLDQQVPTASFFSGAPTLSTLQTSSTAGLRMELPIGTQVELSLNGTRLSTNSTFAFLNPEYDAFGQITMRQPLLGGLWVSARKKVNQAENTYEAEQARYDQQALAVAAETERSYWDLYAAERDFAAQKLSRDRAEAFLRETELKAQAGLVGPNQVATARTFLAQQELQLLDREEELDRQSDLLASYIGARPGDGMNRFIATDEPPTEYQLDSADVLVKRAAESNLDLRAAKSDIDAASSLASAAGWEALPTVNLVGSLGGTGLAGSSQNVIFLSDTLRTTKTGSYGDALTSATKREFPNWSIGLEVSIPIGFRPGLGEKDRLQAGVMSAEQTYLEKSRSLEEQVRSAYREVAHGKDRIRFAQNGVEAAQEQVRIGMIEFHNGRSTAFELVRLGEDLALAEQRFSQALVRTAKAAATLRQLTSTPRQ